MCDRRLSITTSQEGFLKVIVLPLFEALNDYLKRLLIFGYISNIITAPSSTRSVSNKYNST
jgi:hypothetical protein